MHVRKSDGDRESLRTGGVGLVQRNTGKLFCPFHQHDKARTARRGSNAGRIYVSGPHPAAVPGSPPFRPVASGRPLPPSQQLLWLSHWGVAEATNCALEISCYPRGGEFHMCCSLGFSQRNQGKVQDIEVMTWRETLSSKALAGHWRKMWPRLELHSLAT